MVSEISYGVVEPSIAASMSGIEFLQAMMDGKLPRPPMGQRMPMTIKSLERGRIVLSVTADDSYLNPGGLVHGGLALTALDTAMGLAVLSTLGKGKGFASTDTAVRFIRGLQGGDVHELEVVGTVVSSGRTISTAQGEVRTNSGKLVATGTSACAIFATVPDQG
jgi:uncharacterized protein (TIGR00369 family)